MHANTGIYYLYILHASHYMSTYLDETNPFSQSIIDKNWRQIYNWDIFTSQIKYKHAHLIIVL